MSIVRGVLLDGEIEPGEVATPDAGTELSRAAMEAYGVCYATTGDYTPVPTTSVVVRVVAEEIGGPLRDDRARVVRAHYSSRGLVAADGLNFRMGPYEVPVRLTGEVQFGHEHPAYGGAMGVTVSPLPNVRMHLPVGDTATVIVEPGQFLVQVA